MHKITSSNHGVVDGTIEHETPALVTAFFPETVEATEEEEEELDDDDNKDTPPHRPVVYHTFPKVFLFVGGWMLATELGVRYSAAAMLFGALYFTLFMLVLLHHGLTTMRRWEKLPIYTGILGLVFTLVKNPIHYPFLVSAVAVAVHFFVGNVQKMREIKVANLNARTGLYRLEQVEETMNFLRALTWLDRWVYGLAVLPLLAHAPLDVLTTWALVMVLRLTSVTSAVRQNWKFVRIAVVLGLLVSFLVVSDHIWQALAATGFLISLELLLLLRRLFARWCAPWFR